jgi:hypothetical protein
MICRINVIDIIRCPDGVCASNKWVGRSPRGRRAVKARHFMIFF